MCGIAGIFDPARSTPADELEASVRAMRDSLRHRGPDRGDHWCDSAAGIALGHRRLAILDLSAQGNQPMISADGRWVIVYNGEIYNHHELRRELAAGGTRCNGHSDTEALLEGIAAWGLEATLQRSRGMFALALWDRREQRLFLARDRYGEKPLYYSQIAGKILFASELKALQCHADFRAEVDRDVLSLYLRHNYIPAPYCIYQGVAQLSAGCWLAIDASGTVSQATAYWSFRETVATALDDPYVGSEDEAVVALETLLQGVVSERMETDVPLGALLSGGIDSSTIVALMQRQSASPVRTFSIGYAEAGYNESVHAARVAAHLGTVHTELQVHSSDALDLIPSLPELYDEPFADASQLPTALISTLTRNHVTVALTGDGGDEVFGGYNRYFWAQRLHTAAGWAPMPLRRLAAACLRRPSPAAWDRLFAVLPASLRLPMPGDKLHKLAAVLGFSDRYDLYRRLVSHWPVPEDLVIGASEPCYLQNLEQSLPVGIDYARRMMYLDTLSYLPGDILTKVDRASMAASLETRVPFLDHRVAEFAWRLPSRYLIHAGKGKRLLRQLLHRHVPEALVERPKMGFAVPLDAWLRGPLRDWAEHLLDESRLRQQGYLNSAPIRIRWEEHLSGRRNWQYHLWGVLMFQAWQDRCL